MSDPYLYPGTNILKNKLNIKDSKELISAEADFTIVRLKQLLESGHIKDGSIKELCDTNKYIFQDIYEWAGKFRIVDIEKEEAVLGGLSVEYSAHQDIEKDLEKIFNEMAQIQWQALSDEQLTQKISKVLANIWKAHPFREGNTRTSVTFLNLYLQNQSININYKLLAENSLYVRNALVAYNAVFHDLGDLSEKSHLHRIIKDTIEPRTKTIKEKLEEAKQQREQNDKMRSLDDKNNDKVFELDTR